MNIHNDSYQNTCIVIFFFKYDALHFCMTHSRRQQRLVNLIYVVFTDEISKFRGCFLGKENLRKCNSVSSTTKLPYDPFLNKLCSYICRLQ